MFQSCLLNVFVTSFVCSFAQIPVEAFIGHERATADVLWFRYIKDTAGENSRFLFFNRSRAAVDYSNNTTFGLTNALSFNFNSGIGLVAVAQFFGSGFFPKAGIQYFAQKKKFTLFTWLVCETWNNPSIDWFLLSRYEPKLTDKLSLFWQLELVNTTDRHGYYQLVQRARLGLGINPAWQLGLGTDFQQAGKEEFTSMANIGIFLRKVFQ